MNTSGVLLEVQVLELEMRLDDACCLHSRSQNVLLGRNVVRVAQTLDRVQVAEIHY